MRTLILAALTAASLSFAMSPAFASSHEHGSKTESAQEATDLAIELSGGTDTRSLNPPAPFPAPM